MSETNDAKKPEELKDLEPTEDPKGGVLIGLSQPNLVPAVQVPAVQLPGVNLGVENPTTKI
jgi:hypothetical protein